MLTSGIVRFIARNSDALVAFITKLDARLDVFLASIDTDVAAFEDKIETAISHGKAEVARIEAKVEDEVEGLRADLAAKVANKALIAAIKGALPTGAVTTFDTNGITVTSNGTTIAEIGAN